MDWTRPWKIKAPHMRWVALLAPRGRGYNRTFRLPPGWQAPGPLMCMSPGQDHQELPQCWKVHLYSPYGLSWLPLLCSIWSHRMWEIHDMWCLTGDPLQEWWASLSNTRHWVLICVGCVAHTRVVYCCSLYCCCGIWVQAVVVCTPEKARKGWVCVNSGREEPEG